MGETAECPERVLMISKDSIDMGGDTEWEKVEGHRNVEAAATRCFYKTISKASTILMDAKKFYFGI